jgi:hypothetical protein
MATGLSVWTNGLQYAIFSSSDDALQNWNNPGTVALTSGQLNADCTPVTTDLQQGWLVLYGTNTLSPNSAIPYMITQFYTDMTVVLQPYCAQALLFYP